MTLWLDEVRVVKGSAAWTAGFTPPTGPYATGDPAEFTGLVLDRAAVLAATEAADTASSAGIVGLIGTLVVTEAADVAVFTATAVTLGTMAATEAADVVAFAVTVGSAASTGTLAAADASDLANAVSPVAFEAWWNFASGAVDATGNGNNGTLHGTSLTTDYFGRPARSFNGTTDYIDGSTSPLEP